MKKHEFTTCLSNYILFEQPRPGDEFVVVVTGILTEGDRVIRVDAMIRCPERDSEPMTFRITQHTDEVLPEGGF